MYSCFAEASKRSDLTNPNGSLSALLNPAAIKEANEDVKSVTSDGHSKRIERVASPLSFARILLSQQQQSRCRRGNLSLSLTLRKMPSSIEPVVSAWNISKWACPNRTAIEHTRARAVDHAKFKKKNYENLFSRYFGQLYENLHQRKFPAIRYTEL